MLWCTRLHVYISTSLRTCAVDASPTNDNDVIDNDGCGVTGVFLYGKIHLKCVDIFVHFFTTPISILNLTTSSENHENDVSNDILSEWKYSQLFMHESNIFLLKQLSGKYIYRRRVQRWCCSLFIDCAQTDRIKHHSISPVRSLRSLGGYNWISKVCNKLELNR